MNFKAKVLLTIGTGLILISTSVFSTPATPYPVVVFQPDGSTLTLRIYGDESRKIRTTTDGYLVRQNTNGFYIYSEKSDEQRIAKNPEQRNSDDQLYLSRITKHDLQASLKTDRSGLQKAQSISQSTGFPTIGSPKSLVILVAFKDKNFVVSNPANAFSSLLNTEGYSENGGTGSARDYFRASSNGKFNPNFDIVGPYQLPDSMKYYGANDSDDYDVKPTEMVAHACSLANNDVNFSDYDIDGDGYIDNVFIYYAGYNEAEGGPENTIWPHRWVVHSSNYSGNKVFDGKILYDYACTSELRGSSGNNMCGIGTFTHEFGHVIGLPDHYHTDDPDKNTLEYWSIMDYGAYLNQGRTPPAYSSYDRFYLGWLIPEEINTPSHKTLYPLSQSMTPLSNTEGQSYLLSATTHNLNGANPSPKEFFMLEYRKKTGWDSYLPGEGMLIWHIDYNQTAWDDNSPNNYTGSTQTASSHMRIYLQPLSGNTTTPGAPFTSGSFYPKTWSGTSINRPITNIAKLQESMSFTVMGGPSQPVPMVSVGEIFDVVQFKTITIESVQQKQLRFKTTDVSGTITLALSGTDASQFLVSTSSLNASETGAAEGKLITINYKPTTAGTHTAVLTIQNNGGLPERTLELRGSAVE